MDAPPSSDQGTSTTVREDSDPESTDQDGDHPPIWGGSYQLREEQERDHTLKTARRTAGLETSPFYYRQGILYREGASTATGDKIQQVVLPQRYREEALKMSHVTPLAGHFGRTKTLGRLVRLFFWPGISTSVKELCQTCPVCQVTGGQSTPRRTPNHQKTILQDSHGYDRPPPHDSGRIPIHTNRL